MDKKLKYALYTGCTARESTPELLKSTLAIADRLGIELELLDEATCCGASHLQDFDDFLSLVINARTICYAEKRGLDMVTLCNTCQINVSMTKERLDKDEKLKARVNQKLAEVGLEYKGTSKVKHFLYAINDDYGLDNLKEKVTNPLIGKSIAPFYGFHNIRPSSTQSVNNGDENPYRPTSLDKLIVALGGDSVNYSHKNRCCGFHADLQAPGTANKLTGNAMLDAKDNGADIMVTPCPLCHLNMDVKQKAAEKAVGREIGLATLHFPQLVGLALGISGKDLGLKHHVTEVKL